MKRSFRNAAILNRRLPGYTLRLVEEMWTATPMRS